MRITDGINSMLTVVDQGNVAPGGAATLRTAREAERLRASASAKHLAEQRQLSKNIVGEATAVLDRLSRLGAAVGDGRNVLQGVV